MEEIFVCIIRMPKIIVGNKGSVLDAITGQHRNVSKNNYGYLRTGLKVNKVFCSLYVHRIVAEGFYGKSDLTVNHINGNKLDNSLENLEYCTRSENIRIYWSKIKSEVGITPPFYPNGGWGVNCYYWGKRYQLGRFKTKCIAIKFRDLTYRYLETTKNKEEVDISKFKAKNNK